MSESACGKASSGNESVSNNSVECPTCGESFKGESGVKIHHQKIHNESIAGEEVECDWCGEILQRKKYRIEKFDKQFCDEKCQGEYYDEHMEGENAVRWDGGKEKRSCEICGDVFEARPQRDRKLCSKECHGVYMRRIQSGEDHPNWKGGSNGYYGKNWNKQRRKARERDNFRCRDCGVSESNLDRELDVHHITPLRKFKERDDIIWWEEANKLDNLISFCHTCHKKWEGMPIVPYRNTE